MANRSYSHKIRRDNNDPRWVCGFTLIETLIVIAVVATLAVIVFLVLNPVEFLRQARDAQRINDLGALKRSFILFAPSDLDGPNYSNDSCEGQSNQRIFVSVPSDNGETPPAPPSGWSYAQVLTANLHSVNGNGWVPADFTSESSLGVKLPISSLPVDPVNTFASGYYYSYVCGSYEFNAVLESKKYLERQAAEDGGDESTVFEAGNKLTITPLRSAAPALSCSVSPSVVNTDESTTATASGGDGSYSWSAPGGSPASGSGNSFSTSYSTAGSKTITVTSATSSSICNVTVNTPSTPTPTVSSITPSSGANDGAASITTVSGSNFVSGASVKITKSGQSDIFGSGFTVTASDTITGGSLNIVGAATGTWNVLVVNPDSQSGTLANGFTVTATAAPAPTVTGITPGSRGQGAANQTLTINGSNFVSGASVSMSGIGTTVNSTTFVSGSQLTVSATISGTAITGAQDVTVTNPDSQQGTCSGCFIVNAGPISTSATPASSTQGATGLNVTVNGLNFQSGVSASVSGSGVTVNSVTYVSAAQLTLNINIGGSAATGTRNIILTNPDGGVKTGTNLFTVNASPLAPTVSSVSPSSRGQGAANQSIAVNGANFVSGTTVSVSGSGVTVSSTTFVNSAQLSVSLTVGGTAATGTRDITVTNPDSQQGTCSGCFTVNTKPTVSSASPTSTVQGTTGLNVTVNGSDFVSGASSSFSGSGVTVNSTGFVSATQLTININVASNAATGTRSVIITNPDAGVGTGSSMFTVTSAPASTTKTFTFDATLESFAATCVTVVCARDTVDGNPGVGDLQERLTAQNSNQTWQWELSGITWESLGVPVGATVTFADGSYRHRVASSTNMNTATTNSGVLTIRDSAGTTVLGTLESALTYSSAATTTWATRDATGAVSITTNQASNSSIRVRLAGSIRTTNTVGSDVALRQDQIVLIITYSLP